MRAPRLSWMLLGAALGVSWTGTAAADPGPGKSIYSCIGPDGKRIMRDRPIAECMDKDQQQLRPDGSVKGVMKPPPTADEQATLDAELQRMRQERATKEEAAKYDRLLKVRYPDGAAHERARDAALERLRSAIRASDKRLKELHEERQRLRDEEEFYKGRKRPDALKQRVEANEAAAGAQRQLLRQQQDQVDEMNRSYDQERDRLRQLWDGALPGSIGPVPRHSGSLR